MLAILSASAFSIRAKAAAFLDEAMGREHAWHEGDHAWLGVWGAIRADIRWIVEAAYTGWVTSRAVVSPTSLARLKSRGGSWRCTLPVMCVLIV